MEDSRLTLSVVSWVLTIRAFASAVLETPKLETEAPSSGGVDGPQSVSCLRFILLRDCGELPGYRPRGIARPGLHENRNFLYRKSMALKSRTCRAGRRFTAESDGRAEATPTQFNDAKIPAKRPRRTISSAAAFRDVPSSASSSLRASEFFFAHYV